MSSKNDGKLQLNSSVTIIGTKKLSEKEKELILKSETGNKKFIKCLLFDKEGNEIIIKAPIYKSAKGSITAKVNIILPKSIYSIVEEPEFMENISLKEELGLNGF